MNWAGDQLAPDPRPTGAEPSAALEMVEEIPGLGARDLGKRIRAYDRKEFVRELRDHNVTPHIAQKPVERG